MTTADGPMVTVTEEATDNEKEPHDDDKEPHHGDDDDEEHHDPCAENITHFEVVGLEWEEVMVPFSIGIWVLIASVAKLGKYVHMGGGYFHQNRMWMCLPDVENLTFSIPIFA